MQWAGDAQEHLTRGIKLDHKACRRFVATEGHPEIAPDVLNAVRSKTAMDLGIGKRLHQLEVLVEDVDAAVGAVVGGIKKVTRGVAGDRQACVDGTDGTFVRWLYSDQGVGRVEVRIPTADGAVQGGKEEEGGSRRVTF